MRDFSGQNAAVPAAAADVVVVAYRDEACSPAENERMNVDGKVER